MTVIGQDDHLTAGAWATCDRTGDKTSHKHLRSWVGQEYKPYDLLFGSDRISCLMSSGVVGLKKK